MAPSGACHEPAMRLADPFAARLGTLSALRSSGAYASPGLCRGLTARAAGRAAKKQAAAACKAGRNAVQYRPGRAAGRFASAPAFGAKHGVLPVRQGTQMHAGPPAAKLRAAAAAPAQWYRQAPRGGRGAYLSSVSERAGRLPGPGCGHEPGEEGTVPPGAHGNTIPAPQPRGLSGGKGFERIHTGRADSPAAHVRHHFTPGRG